MNNLKWLLIGIAVLLGLYALLQVRESGYTTPTGQVFPENTDDIYRVEMMTKDDILTLQKKDLEWTIVGHDTLKIRDLRITALFEQVLKVSRETTMTDKSDNWSKYAVDDAMGTHVKVYNAKDELLAHAVFGRSSTDWARNYVRIGDGPEVYLTDRSIVYQVSTDATFWGEKLPEPTPAAVDSADVAPAPAVVDSAKAGDEG